MAGPGLDMGGTEDTPHVADLMGAAHTGQAALYGHGADAVQAGPSTGDDGMVDVPVNDSPPPLGWTDYPGDYTC